MNREEMKLLPCPFCGGEAKSVGPYGESLFKVECQICTAKVSGFDQCRQDAIDAWNTRAALRASAAPSLSPDFDSAAFALGFQKVGNRWIHPNDDPIFPRRYLSAEAIFNGLFASAAPEEGTVQADCDGEGTVDAVGIAGDTP